MRRAVAASLPVLVSLLCWPAAAQERVSLRVGDHPGLGRVVFDWPREVAYRVETAPGRVTLRFAAPGAFDPAPARLPRNVTGIRAEGESVEITLAPDSRPRVFRLGNRVVLDVADAAPGAAQSATPPAPRSAAEARPVPQRAARAPQALAPQTLAPQTLAPQTLAPQILPTRPPARNAARTTAQPPAQPPALAIAAAPVVPVTVAELPTPAPAPIAPRALAVSVLPGGGLAIPAAAEIGAALFRRGEVWLLVLDAPLSLDLAALAGHPALASTEITRGQQATTLRLPAAAFAAPVLRREGPAWLLEAPNTPPALRSILPEIEAGPPRRLVLRTEHAGTSLAVLDPETGGVMLVGTQRQGGSATPIGRRSATLEILATRLGVAILPRADTLSLRALEGRFVLDSAPGAALPMGEAPDAAAVDAASMSRHFDLPGEALSALQERLRNANVAIAAAAPLGRGQPRLRSAEALLALGLPQEAQSMVGIAMRDDPRLAESPRARALHGAAALMAGRVAEADGLAAPGLPNTDEARLWRGLYDATRGGEHRAGAASAIAAGLPLLLSYPEPLRARLLPIAAEALLDGGEAPAVRRLLAARPAEEATLALAHARMLEANGAIEPALAAYAVVAGGRDRRARAVALRRAAELRLANGQLDAAGAAAAIEATLAAWRGDALESEARLRLAALRMAAQDPRGAFEQLRETEALFPELAPQLLPLQSAALLGALEREPPIAAVALFDAQHALLPPGPASDTALASLADRLAALDLVDRAQHVLQRALSRAAGDESRAQIGLRMAHLALGAGDAARARVALSETEGRGLPAALVTERILVDARALNRLGQHDAGAARFRAAGEAGLPELVEALAERQDWAGAAQASQALMAARLPAVPAPLAEADRRLIVRSAALLGLAGQESGLAALRVAEAGRMAGGPLDEAFSLITGAAMESVGDLPRLRQELELARALPSRLESLRVGSAATR